MSRMLFLNLPVKDLDATKGFFGELGFEFNPDYSDDTAVCMVVDENILVMMLTENRFRDFITGEIADASTTTEAITSLSADSKEQVDELADRAIAAGGKAWKPTMEEGPMYVRSFQDLDGHVWELVYMEQS